MSGPASSAVCVALHAALANCAPAPRRVFVAYSGGADSTALLLAGAVLAREADFELRAFHFDHRLHPDSARWATHCRACCAGIDVALDLVTAQTGPPAGASVEAWAREVRYAAAAGLLDAGDVMLTAHHRDDLVETVLLAALRGSGPHGLAAIAPARPLGAGSLLRPLLELPRATLRAAVDEAGIDVIADPANDDPRHDRSFLRAEILPRLAARWPSSATSFARVARLQRAAAGLLDAAADDWLHASGATSRVLPMAELAALPAVEASMRLRRWLWRVSGHAPDARVIEHALRELVHSRRDASPLLAWRGGQLRRHRARLYWLPHPPQPLQASCEWDIGRVLRLPGGELRARPTHGEGVTAGAIDGPLSVCARRGGERIRPPGRSHSQTVKQLLQESGMPPWERAQLPLVYRAQTLLAVGDLAIAGDLAARPGEPGVVFEYLRD